ncbi:hypothetical protein ACFPQ5_00715 [Massilia suwonensis]|uniref:Uncharacterized protein n=2 Tax=Massilia suwonensis TaxID=648895 RepID=A0ABW0MIA8_9BURK
MSLSFDAVVSTDQNEIDMKAGLNTFTGASDAVRCIVETIVTERVPERQTHKGKVRTLLKHSFKGSYGIAFSVELCDPKFETRFQKIKKTTYAELVSYYLNEAMYQHVEDLSLEAQGIVDRLGAKSDDLITQLRKSALENMHDISIKFNQDVKLRYRFSRDRQLQLVAINQETAKVLEAGESKEVIDIVAGITRFNTKTGNGRLQLKDELETVAFGFNTEYVNVKFEAKKRFSINLDKNNGVPKDKWDFVKLSVSPIKLKDGRVVKYIVKGIYD